MGKTARFKLHAVLSLLLLNYFCMISAQELISKSKLNSPADGQSTREIVKVDRENLIVAEEISCWEQNGHWEELKLCPNSTIVTGHRFRYLVRTGPTGIELKCTEKYGPDQSESVKTLVINFENKVEQDLPRGKWENWKNGSRSVFAAGFSFNRGELSLGRSVKNYDLIYHSGNQTAVNSDKVVRKCPEDHAICGVTAMMDKAQLGILTAIGFKCCHHCVPEEKWVTIHHYDNTGVSEEEKTVSTTVGLQWSLGNSADYVKIPHSVLHTGFSTHFGKNLTGFDWTLTPYSIWTEKNSVNATLICEEQSSCVLKQIVGQCGSARVPVAKFCTVSVPIGSSIPDSCNLTPTLEQDPSEKTIVGKTVVDRNDPIPYQLSIRYNKNPPDGEWSHICDGVILDENTAITAAHCFEGVVNVSHYRVVAGANLLNSTDAREQVLELKKVVTHPNYTTATNGNDLAILHVDKFQFNKNVGGVWLSPFSNKELADKSAVNSGWGDVSSKSGLSNSLLKEIVYILSPEDCLNRLQSRRYAKVREGVLCALNPLARTCTGDSGGPLVIQNYPPGDFNRNFLLGLASFALVNCAQLVKVGVFTEISSFYNWIQENRATPLDCGGFIRLNGEQEIVYTVPKELRGQKSVCVWVVAASGASAIQMQVLHNPKALFQSAESTLFTIHDFTKHSFSHSKILKENKILMMEQPFFVLYYRTTSAAPNSGFHILLKEAGEKKMQTPVKYLELQLKDGVTPEIQEFKYPPFPAMEYANDERTFIIVKPGARHVKLELDLKSVSTEHRHDWMQITSVKSEPVSHFRFSGEASWSDNYFEAEEDEPFIVYFHSGESDTKAGFNFSYSAQNKSESRVNRRCGGFINLDQEQEIIYKVPSEEPERQRGSICLWVVSTGRKDVNASIKATILSNPSAQFNPDSDVIIATYNFTIANNQYKTIIQGPFMTLYYRTNSSAPNAGFHLKLKDSITQSNITERLNVKLISMPNAKLKEGETREFEYPSSVSGASEYSSNERTFVILKPQKPGTKIRVNLKSLDTEENYDWLQIETYRMGPPALASFNGRNYQWRQPFVSEGPEDQPIFFYFHSDQSNERGGFKFQYSETLLPKPKSSCGGYVELDWEKEIVYTVPEELRGQKSVCVWVIEAPRASSIEMELLSNPNAQFQSQESTLFAIYDFKIDGFKHSKILSKDEKWTINHGFFVLYFRTNSSAPNSGFHIHLKEKGQKKWQKNLKYLELGLETGNTSEIQELKYPLPLASSYNKRTFIIVKPGARHDKLKLELHYVETQSHGDWVEVFSVESKPISHFRSSQDWNSGRVFEAAEDEPIIIYFQSNRSATESGFEFSYAEKKTFEVKSRPLTFYEDADFSGPEIKLHVRNFCQDIPSAWNGKVSSLNSTLCLTFYEDKACSSRSLQLTGSHSDLSLYDLDNKISSFELCETTNKREESPFFVTAYEFENFTGESTKLSLDCGCVGYKFGWNNRINSIENPQNLCVVGYDDLRCKGKGAVISSDSPRFQSKGINNTLTSFRICPGRSKCP